MKVLVKAAGLALALVLLVLSTASANMPVSQCTSICLGCYVSCPDDIYIISASNCCGEINRYEFTCPGGSTAYGYGYDFGQGPQFCTS